MLFPPPRRPQPRQTPPALPCGLGLPQLLRPVLRLPGFGLGRLDLSRQLDRQAVAFRLCLGELDLHYMQAAGERIGARTLGVPALLRPIGSRLCPVCPYFRPIGPAVRRVGGSFSPIGAGALRFPAWTCPGFVER